MIERITARLVYWPLWLLLLLAAVFGILVENTLVPIARGHRQALLSLGIASDTADQIDLDMIIPLLMLVEFLMLLLITGFAVRNSVQIGLLLA